MSVIDDDQGQQARRGGRRLPAATGTGRGIANLFARVAAACAGAGLMLSLGVSGAAALDGPSGPERGDQASGTNVTTASSSTVTDIARQYVGTPYVWGGSTPAGFDCSGFVQYVFMHVGIDLPRTADLQGSAGVEVPADEAVPGDLVWWPGHIGIYTGDGNHIAARNPDTLLYESPIYRVEPTFIRVFENVGEDS